MINLKSKAVGYLLTNDRELSILNFDKNNHKALLTEICLYPPRYALGDIGPMGGKVYYIDDSGEHGLESKLLDEPEDLIWSSAINSTSANNFAWHLPTKPELGLLFNQKDLIGGFTDYFYWSSSECGHLNAWFQSFSNGAQRFYYKDNPLRVRAVHAF